MATFETMGPASTPQLYLKNQYRLLQQQAADWERNLQTQGLDEQSYTQAVQDMQKQLDGQISAFQARSQQLQQTQSMIDLNLIGDPDAGMEAMWSAVLPEETMQAMFPKQERPDSSRLSQTEMGHIGKSVEQFASQIPKTTIKKRYSWTGLDWPVRDIRGRSQADIIKMYTAWKNSIGYGKGADGMSPIERRQVDTEWDAWIATQKGTWKWNPNSNQVKALRAGGPLTRVYGAEFRKTPTGPTEATSPLQLSIARALPKKKENDPTVEQLRKIGTQEAYDIGKNLGYWN